MALNEMSYWFYETYSVQFLQVEALQILYQTKHAIVARNHADIAVDDILNAIL